MLYRLGVFHLCLFSLPTYLFSVDYCDFPDFTPSGTSRECNPQNCLCRLQLARESSSTPSDFTSIEDGCFRVQSCPELQLSIIEPIKCLIDAKHEVSFTRGAIDYNSGTDVFESNEFDPNTSGTGTVFTFPGGLSAGQETSIRYSAAGHEDLVLGLGIGCDGFLYLLSENPSSGDYSCSLSQTSTGYCSGSCPECSFCTPQGDGFIYYTKTYATVNEINNGLVLKGVAYYENDDTFNCSHEADYSYCSGTNDETLINVVCSIESVFEQDVEGTSQANTNHSGIHSYYSFLGIFYVVIISLLETFCFCN